MKKILFNSENEALEFCYDMDFDNPEKIAVELKKMIQQGCFRAGS